MLEARDAVTLLRDELWSHIRADTQSAWAGGAGRARYQAALRGELARAERRLAALEARHRRLREDRLPAGA